MATKKPSYATMKKRKRKKHYKTGLHSSNKCENSPMKYRSGWELVVAEYFDASSDVKSYSYETLKIPYVSNRKSSRVRYYIPDFVVTYTSGRKVIVEVKRKSALNQLTVMKKAEFASYYATSNNMEYEFWTEDTIKKLKQDEKQSK